MSESEKKPLGRILLEQKAVDPEKLEGYLKQQESTEERLASIIARQGDADEAKLLKALSAQKGVPGIDLSSVVMPLSNLDIVPREIATKHLILPVIVKESQIFLAMSDPEESRVIEELEFVTGKKVFPYVALHHVISSVVDACYRLKDEGESFFRGEHVSDEKYARITGLFDGSPVEAASHVASRDDEVFSDMDMGAPAGPGLEVDQEPDLGSPSPVLDVPPPAVAGSPDDEITIQLDSSMPKILVVDDELDILNLIEKVLTDKGFRVITATRGREALNHVKTEYPDLIILDAMLPEVHGFDVCKKIKGSAKYGHIPVIMISAIYRGWRFAKDLTDSYGVDLFIEKPFKINELLKAVQSQLQKEKTRAKPDTTELSIEAQRQLDASAEAFQKNDIDAAIEHLRQGIAIDPLSDKLHYNLALLYGKKGMNYYAISELETVLELAPGSFQAMKNLAVLYQQAGFKNKAIEMWERAMGVCPDEETREQIKAHLLGLL
jgi:DNA-binding response OmpR family regulator